MGLTPNNHKDNLTIQLTKKNGRNLASFLDQLEVWQKLRPTKQSKMDFSFGDLVVSDKSFLGMKCLLLAWSCYWYSLLGLLKPHFAFAFSGGTQTWSKECWAELYARFAFEESIII